MIDTSNMSPDEAVRHMPIEACDEPDTEPAHGSIIPFLFVSVALVFSSIAVVNLIARLLA